MEVSGPLHTLAGFILKLVPVLTSQVGGLARETAWMPCSMENYLVVFQKWNPICRSASYHPGSIPGELCRICGQLARAKTLFLRFPISIITPKLHIEFSLIYLRRYTIVANGRLMNQNASLYYRTGRNASSPVTLPTQLSRFKQPLHYATWTDRWHN